MKKFLVFILLLSLSIPALADGGIPLLAFMGTNFFITGNIAPPFFLGLLLLWIVCFVEKVYLVKKLNPKEKIYGYIIKANIYSTILGGLLTIFLYSLCHIIPCLRSDCDLGCYMMGPIANILELLVDGIHNPVFTFIATLIMIVFYPLLFWWLSWFVEYRYLRRKLNYPDLKKRVAIANIYSYLIMFILVPLFGWYIGSFF